MSIDFNDAGPQQSGNYDPIPKGTVAPVRFTFKEQAIVKYPSGVTMLDVEFVVTRGQYAKRKVWQKIGIAGVPGNDGHVKMVEISKAFLRAALESAYGIKPEDASPEARAARTLSDWSDLDGLEFLARFDVQKGEEYTDKKTGEVKPGRDQNTLSAVTPDDPDYGPFQPAKPKARGGTRQVANGTAAKQTATPDWA